MIITDADSTPILSISFLHILAGDKLSHKIFLILTFKTHYKQKRYFESSLEGQKEGAV